MEKKIYKSIASHPLPFGRRLLGDKIKIKQLRDILLKEKRNPTLYIPILELLEREQKPLGIEYIAEIFNLTYQITKHRLHFLEKRNIIVRLKREYISY